MTTTKEMLEKVLLDLKKIGDIEASAVVSRDGLLIAADIPKGIEAITFAAMNATMLGAAETMIFEMEKGYPNRIIVESKEAKVIITGAGSKALLVVMTLPEAGLGLVLVEIEKAAKKIEALLL